VFLPGLTFGRRSWDPITERLGDGVLNVTIDLPGQGGTPGPACTLAELADEVGGLLTDLQLERPIVVGHSMSGAVAYIYAVSHSVRGVVNVDQVLGVEPFAEVVNRLGPALRGTHFAEAFSPFLESMGVDLLPEPLRSRTRAAQEVRQETVVGYWDEILRSEPAQLQARIDETLEAIDVPSLNVFGQVLPAVERDRLRRLRDVQIEEWLGGGHCLHLADPNRFARRLRAFIDYCVEPR
jgi:pimeloyl-ACP methyl ester carboxylesterase